jgi:lysozyme
VSLFSWLFPKAPTGRPVTPSVPVAPPAPQAPVTSVKPTSPSAALLAFIEAQESFQAEAYWDVDGYAIGYGAHFINGIAVVKGQTIDQASAGASLRMTAQACAKSALACVTASVTQGQLDALVDFVYNVGIGALQRSTLLKTLNANGTVTEDMFTVWSKMQNESGVLITSPNLLARRSAEFQQFWSA